MSGTRPRLVGGGLLERRTLLGGELSAGGLELVMGA
jgi:hypothetical protein